MKCKHIPSAAIVLIAAAASFSACEDNLSEIGSSLSRGEVTITVDSSEYNLEARSLYSDVFDSRSLTLMMGNIDVPEYGSLKCSFVSRLMPATALTIPDSISLDMIDSAKFIAVVPRSSVTGDTLAPMQMNVYQLTRQLPSDITNNFDPTGYYDPENPFGTRTYTLSGLAYSDSVFNKATALPVAAALPQAFARDLVNKYRTEPQIFQWPSTFAKYFPGVFVETAFGNGSLASVSRGQVVVYYHYTIERSFFEDGETVVRPVLMKDSVALLSTAPEVLSSNRIAYTPSQSLRSLVDNGKILITSPGGYYASVRFPAQKILDEYYEQDFNMAVISNLSLTIPATAVTNDFGIGTAPDLLLVKASEYPDFFNNNTIPDNKTSFYASYSSSKGSYSFSSMRNYILDVMEKGKTVAEEDMEFIIVPVKVTTETETNSYTGATTIYVTRVAPYQEGPTMTLLDTERAMICFTFSQQTIR